MQPSRTATVREVDRARKRAASRERAQNLGYRTNRWRLITRNDPLDSPPAHVRLARRSLALRPAHARRHLYVASYTEGFSHFVTSMTAPVASGLSVRRVGLAPTGKRRLLTAHANSGHCPRACPFRSLPAGPDTHGTRPRADARPVRPNSEDDRAMSIRRRPAKGPSPRSRAASRIIMSFGS